jgi:hypothetical protein
MGCTDIRQSPASHSHDQSRRAHARGRAELARFGLLSGRDVEEAIRRELAACPDAAEPAEPEPGPKPEPEPEPEPGRRSSARPSVTLTSLALVAAALTIASTAVLFG